MPQTEGGGGSVRKRVNAFFRKHFLPSTTGPSPPSPAHSSPSISRRSTNHGQDIPQLRSHHPPGGISVADRPVTLPRPATGGGGGGQGTGTRRRRRRRRTTSPVGLPLYSKDPGEEEMSLFKSEIDLTLSEYPSRVGEDEGEEELDSSESEGEDEAGEEEDEPRGRPSRDLDPSLHVRPSFDASTEEGGSGAAFVPSSARSSFQTPRPRTPNPQSPLSASTPGGLVPPPSLSSLHAGPNRPRSASAPLAHLAGSSSSPLSSSPQLTRYLSNSPGSSSPFASRSGLIDLPANQLEAGSSPTTSRPSSPIASRPPVALRTTWGYSASNPNSPYSHRSTHSSPSNTLAPPLSASPPSGIGLGRPRSSTLQRMFASSSRNASNVSLSTAFADPASAGRSPYGQGGGGGGTASASMARLASSSSASISTRDISAPMPNSFVHSSFIFPRSGPTAAQVAFISSRESLGAYGYGAGVAKEAPFSQPPTFEAATSTVSLALPAATPGGGECGPSIAPVQGRGRSASSASRMSDMRSSPLARVETLTPPPSPPPSRSAASVARPAEHRGEGYAEDEAQEIKEGAAPSSPSAPAATLPTKQHRPSLSIELPLLDNLPSLPSFASSSSPPSPSPAAVPPNLASSTSTASSPPPPPPEIALSAPTPTASAAPSPLLPHHPSSTPPLPDLPTQSAYFDFPSSSSFAKPTGEVARQEERQRARREINISTVSEASFLTDASYRTAVAAPPAEGEGETAAAKLGEERKGAEVKVVA